MDSAVDPLEALGDRITACRRCERLVAWREEVAANPRASFADQVYWGRPITGFGDPRARIVVVGLAPAAHGANRTGRVFTGDRSGDFLFAALHRAGLASQPNSVSRDDGLELHGCYVTAVVRCAPPSNKPTPAERDACLPYLIEELDLLSEARCVLALGAFAADGVRRAVGLRGRADFGHGAVSVLDERLSMVCSYHPSQQNTFTGRLTEPMFDEVIALAVEVSRS